MRKISFSFLSVHLSIRISPFNLSYSGSPLMSTSGGESVPVSCPHLYRNLPCCPLLSRICPVSCPIMEYPLLSFSAVESFLYPIVKYPLLSISAVESVPLSCPIVESPILSTSALESVPVLLWNLPF
jgi:hypothetical protein